MLGVWLIFISFGMIIGGYTASRLTYKKPRKWVWSVLRLCIVIAIISVSWLVIADGVQTPLKQFTLVILTTLWWYICTAIGITINAWFAAQSEENKFLGK